MTCNTLDLCGHPAAALNALAEDVSRWPSQLAEMTDLVAVALAVLPAPEARRLAAHVIVSLCRAYGGGSVYIPKPDAIERALRDLTLWAEHDGTVDGPHGIRVLARRYKLSEQRVWNLLKVEHERHLRRVRPELSER